MESVRVDKWIWATRMVKTRALGKELCRAGHVLLNDRKVKPSSTTKIGDVIEVRNKQVVKKYKVLMLTEKRLGAKEASKLFEDLSPPPPLRPFNDHQVAKREKGSGRPTKKERRKLDKGKDWANKSI